MRVANVGDERLGASRSKTEVPWRARLGVHRVPRGLQGVQQAGTVFGAQRLLHLVHVPASTPPGAATSSGNVQVAAAGCQVFI